MSSLKFALTLSVVALGLAVATASAAPMSSPDGGPAPDSAAAGVPPAGNTGQSSPASPDATAAPAEASGPAVSLPVIDSGPPGDLITLKTGRVYRGFQVLKSSSAEVLVEVAPGVTISIPRRQIVSVEYDDIDPVVEAQRREAAEAAANAAAEKAATELLSGQKVSPEIQAKLATDISDPPFRYEKRLLGDIFTDLNKRPKIDGVVEVDRAIRQLPAEQRQWTIASTPGMTLAGVLGELKRTLPHLATVIRDDKLFITNQATARELLGVAAPAPEPGGAPAAAPKAATAPEAAPETAAPSAAPAPARAAPGT